MIWKLSKFLFLLALVGAGIVAGYALMFDLPAEKQEITIEIQRQE